jgi:hypothetical protein
MKSEAELGKPNRTAKTHPTAAQNTTKTQLLLLITQPLLLIRSCAKHNQGTTADAMLITQPLLYKKQSLLVNCCCESNTDTNTPIIFPKPPTGMRV